MATRPARASQQWTYSEFARLPNDGNHYEVIAGELYMTPAPRPFHQEIVARVLDVLRPYVAHQRLGVVLPGPIDVLFVEGDYVQPDVVFVRRERGGIITDRGVEGAPDLVVEVLSESTAVRDRGIKRERYAWFGVPEYWLIDPGAGHIEVYRPSPDADAPQIVHDTLRWSPSAGAPVLEIPVAELLRGFE